MYINRILYSNEKLNLTICDNINRSRGYCAKCNKSDKERQIPYGFNYMWNLKTKDTNKTKTDSQKQRPKEWLP